MTMVGQPLPSPNLGAPSTDSPSPLQDPSHAGDLSHPPSPNNTPSTAASLQSAAVEANTLFLAIVRARLNRALRRGMTKRMTRTAFRVLEVARRTAAAVGCRPRWQDMVERLAAQAPGRRTWWRVIYGAAVSARRLRRCNGSCSYDGIHKNADEGRERQHGEAVCERLSARGEAEVPDDVNWRSFEGQLYVGTYVYLI